ncbi:hypothetical protein NP493_270g03060 [Ridgeia piscesae]|uniref:Cystatin domain-containing protein n=1 Tax=Ridgeia piscesae TaxID=27915 RepID=A0AAD9UCD4_RIDPI|nr:hypothetical protein NP493_270g03060 [Ridgeia piscesae]
MERVVSTFLASVVVLLGISSVSACVDRAKPALGMLGGWRQVDLIHADDVLLAKAAAYAEEAVVEMNKLSNEVTPYELATNPKTGEYRVVEVYTQVVAGVNYCIKFEVQSAGCQNNINHDDCDNDKRICEAEVWEQPLIIQGQPKVTVSEIKCD